MAQYIDKSAVIAEIENKINKIDLNSIEDWRYRLQREHDIEVMKNIISLIDTLEVIDPYEQIVQYASIEAGIKAHAETYSFNIESLLFNQLTSEQQKIWHKEIEQAVISGGEMGVELARDARYKENFEVKEVNLEKEIDLVEDKYRGFYSLSRADVIDIAKHFFELGLKTSNSITEVNLESLVRQVIGLYLEAGKHYNSVIEEERKEYGGSDLAIKLFDGVIDAKELSIQYILDKLKAQKGE